MPAYASHLPARTAAAALALATLTTLSGCGEAVCDATLRIDGLAGGDGVTCSEYAMAPVVGVFGSVRVAFANGRLHLHNDWVLRDDADTPADAYNLFELNESAGAHRIEVRVYRDGRLLSLVDGIEVEHAGDSAAAAFKGSDRKATPHMQYEFALTLPPGPSGDGALYWLREKDPPPGPLAPPYTTLVTEPTTLLVDTHNGGSVEDKGDVPVLVSARRDGDGVIVSGLGLGAGGTVKRANLRPATVTAWSPEEVRVVGPAFEAGERLRVVREDKLQSNPVALLALDVPPWDGKDCTGLPAGKDCDDGKSCTTGDACDGNGACKGKVSCGPDLPCQANVCGGDGSCKATPLPQGVVCGAIAGCSEPRCDGLGSCKSVALDDNYACDDNKACTQVDRCTAGVCAGLVACPPPNSCVSGACGADGACAFAPIVDGTGCFDGDHCSVGDQCVAGACKAGADAVPCDDSDPCTLDGCDPKIGCVYEKVPKADGCGG